MRIEWGGQLIRYELLSSYFPTKWVLFYFYLSQILVMNCIHWRLAMNNIPFPFCLVTICLMMNQETGPTKIFSNYGFSWDLWIWIWSRVCSTVFFLPPVFGLKLSFVLLSGRSCYSFWGWYRRATTMGSTGNCLPFQFHEILLGTRAKIFQIIE